MQKLNIMQIYESRQNGLVIMDNKKLSLVKTMREVLFTLNWSPPKERVVFAQQ